MLIIDPLKSFNNVIEYYHEVLNLTGKLFIGLSPQTFTKDTNLLNQYNYYLASIQAIIFNKSLKIQMLEELITNNEIYDTEIDKIFSTIDSFESIKTLQPMSQKEKCKQIRNCLAHSMFEIRINNEKDISDIENVDNISLYINNGKVSGIIPYKDFYILDHSYQELYGNISPNTKINIPDFRYKTSEFKKNNSSDDKEIKKYINSLRVKGEPITPEKKLFLAKYIKHIGLSNFQQLSPLHKHVLLTDCLMYPSNKDEILAGELGIRIDPGTNFIDTIRHWNFLGDDSIAPNTFFTKNFILQNNLKLFCHEKPLIYASCTLGLANYCMSYIREINQNSTKPIFEYKNIDLSNIKHSINSNNSISIVDPRKEILQEINLIECQKERISKDILRIKDTIKNLSNPLNRNPRKDEFLKNNNKDLQEKSEELKQLEQKLIKLNEEYENCTEEPYENSYHFFRHLRNSIAHGHYVIDFKKFFNTRKLEDISFTFYDNIHSKDDSFSVHMKVSELFEIVNNLQEKINLSIEENDIGSEIQKRYLEEALVKQNIGLSDIHSTIKGMEDKENSNVPEQTSK